MLLFRASGALIRDAEKMFEKVLVSIRVFRQYVSLYRMNSGVL